jgi:ribonuclease-3
MRRARSVVNPRCPIACAPTVVTTPDAPQSKRSRATSALGSLGVPTEGGPIYELALTHRSFAFEQPEVTANNERLEFLGDAILEAVVTDLIYRENPDLAEGEMARLRASVVNTHALAHVASELGLGDHIRLGKGEEASGGREKPSLLANTFEAVVGAVYLDRGIEVVREALTPIFQERIRNSLDRGDRYDAKTALQEVAVREAGSQPRYRVASSGPDHDKRFTADVYVEETLMGSGTGRSKKEAEYNAAREALERMEEQFPASSEGGGADARAS